MKEYFIYCYTVIIFIYKPIEIRLDSSNAVSIYLSFFAF